MVILLFWVLFLNAFCACFCLVYFATTRRRRASEANEQVMPQPQPSPEAPRPPARPGAVLVPRQRGTSRSET